MIEWTSKECYMPFFGNMSAQFDVLMVEVMFAVSMFAVSMSMVELPWLHWKSSSSFSFLPPTQTSSLSFPKLRFIDSSSADNASYDLGSVKMASSFVHPMAASVQFFFVLMAL